MSDKRAELIMKAAVTVLVCALAGLSMWLTGGAKGIGWAIFGIVLVWGDWM